MLHVLARRDIGISTQTLPPPPPPALPLDGMPVHRMVDPSTVFDGTYFHTWPETRTAAVKSDAQEHSSMT